MDSNDQANVEANAQTTAPAPGTSVAESTATEVLAEGSKDQSATEQAPAADEAPTAQHVEAESDVVTEAAVAADTPPPIEPTSVRGLIRHTRVRPEDRIAPLQAGSARDTVIAEVRDIRDRALKVSEDLERLADATADGGDEEGADVLARIAHGMAAIHHGLAGELLKL